MNKPCFPFLRHGCTAAFALLLAANAPGQAEKPATGPVSIPVARDDARQRANQGKLEDAEKLLTQLNRAAPNTADWHMETAMNLAHMAGELAAGGQLAAVIPAAQRAMVHLRVAERLAPTAELKANARQIAGFLCERFLGDVEAAKANYRAAVQHSPNDAAARARLDKIEHAEENARPEKRQGGS